MFIKRWFYVKACTVVLLISCVFCSAKSEISSKQDKSGNAGEILETFVYESVAEFKETEAERHARMAWWIDARFGQFFCWGPASLTGMEIGWNRGGERRDGSGTGSIPPEIYDNLYTSFNPSLFDANEWIQTAKDAGTKYILFLLKHHDGFCLWDTKTTDYKITSPKSPFRRDIAREIADACHKADMKLIWYYSLGDWYDPDYYTENHARFEKNLLEQIRELCANYGKIYGFWFDLAYPKMYENKMGQKISNLIHSLQPGAIINNRGGLKGDYDTPEQRIGTFQTNRPWESCITLGTQWSWKPKDNIKLLKECIYILVNAVGGDGNLALNINPMPDGRIEPRQVERLKEVGDWLKKYGESIYGTRGGPFMPGDFGSSTHKGNKIYLHVLNWDDNILFLPPLSKKIISSSLLTGGKVSVEQTCDEIAITVDKQYQQEVDTIVVLELDGSAGEVSPVITASGSLAFRKKTRTSSISDTYGSDNAFDGDDKTSWVAIAGATQAWIEVDLGKTCTVAQAVIYETFPGRIKQFELQYKIDGNWKNVYSGIELGAQAIIRFKPVEAQHFRLNVSKSDDSPAIAEFKLTGPIASADKEYKFQGTAVSDEKWSAYLDHWVKVGASSVHQNQRQYGPNKLLDGGRWIPGNVATAWLDIDFGRSRTVNQAVISTNRYWQKVKEFELQRLINDEWQTFYNNKELNKTSGTLKLEFEPVTLSQVRMKITMDGTAYIEANKLVLSNTSDPNQ